MRVFITIGKFFFAVAFIGLGIAHFIFQDFMIGRAPAWPDQVPGKLVWAYLSGTIFIIISLIIILDKKARLAAVFGSLIILLWAFLRHIPIVAADPILTPSWTKAGKALVFFSGALTIAATLQKIKFKHNFIFLKIVNLKNEFLLAGRTSLGIFLLITGTQHFIYTEFVASLIPWWFPGNAVFWTYLAGVLLISGGMGLIIPRTSKLTALLVGLMIFSWFWIIHIPRTFAGVSDGIAVFEALATAGIAFVIFGFQNEIPPALSNAISPARTNNKEVII